VARQHVDVEVPHGLAGHGAVGLQQCDALRLERRLRGQRHAARGLHDGGGFVGREVEQGAGVALAGHQHVAGVDLAQVHEGQGQLVLKNTDGRDLTGNQLAKKALAGGRGVDEFGHGGVSWSKCPFCIGATSVKATSASSARAPAPGPA
jgi:hypothetical protein